MNVLVKPYEQSSSLLESSAMARKRTFKNVLVKPYEQSSSLLESSAMARKRTFKNVLVKPEDQRELARFGLARTDEIE